MVLQQRAVGTFSNDTSAQAALSELQKQGFPMDRVSLLGRDMRETTKASGANTSNQLADIERVDTQDNKAAEKAKDGVIAGSSVGALTGLLVGLGALAIPGVGPVMMAGAAATAIATTISGGVIGAAAGSLVGGLVGLGIPKDRAEIYNNRFQQGDYLVIVEGSTADINLAQSIFSKHGLHEWYAYDLSGDSIPPDTRVSAPHPRV